MNAHHAHAIQKFISHHRFCNFEQQMKNLNKNINSVSVGGRWLFGAEFYLVSRDRDRDHDRDPVRRTPGAFENGAGFSLLRGLAGKSNRRTASVTWTQIVMEHIPCISMGGSWLSEAWPLLSNIFVKKTAQPTSLRPSSDSGRRWCLIRDRDRDRDRGSDRDQLVAKNKPPS